MSFFSTRKRQAPVYLVRANDVREAAQEAFVLVIAFHQEMQVLLRLQRTQAGVIARIQKIKQKKMYLRNTPQKFHVQISLPQELPG